MKRHAFTLIELLVVIAIIAILAAILFPVFAQAKQSAKKTQALAHLKQIGTAATIYATDYDDRFPSIFDGAPAGGNPEVVMQPYMRNGNMWYVNREDKTTFTVDAAGNYIPGRSDFGYNWGFEIRSAEGVIDGETCTIGLAVSACSGNRVNVGKSITQFANPSRTFLFGDTYDTPRQTIGGDGWQLDVFPTGVTQNSRLRYGGQMVYVMADSSARSVPTMGGTVAWGRKGRVSSPRRFQDRVDGYCSDPEGPVRPFPRSNFPLGTNWICRDFVALPEASGVVWWSN